MSRSLETLPDTYRNFVPALRETLINLIGDHKWFIQIISEQADPQFFNTTDDEYQNKFLCDDTCVCEGEGDCYPDDCECTFQDPKTAIIVQYNTNTGLIEEDYLLNEVQKAAAEAGLLFHETHIVHFGLYPAEPTPAEKVVQQLLALGDITTVRETLKIISNFTSDIAPQQIPTHIENIRRQLNKNQKKNQ